jgi:hypothetical protein
MEGFALLLGLAVITCVFVLPIAAFVRAGSSRQDIERLEASVAELWVQVSRLRDLLESSRGQSTRTDTPSAETEIAPSPGPVEAAPPSTETRPEPEPPVVREAPRRRPPTLVAPFELPPVLPKQELEAEEPPKLEPEPAGETQPASSSPPPLRPLAPAFDWERFMGAKLFAWLGGLALFLAVAYLVKYSFENNLIPPEVRVGFGFLLGIGLVVSGVLWQRKAYVVTSHTLCATGVVILYAVTFSCRAVYHFAFFGPTATFLFMTLITATAFLLAVRMDAMVVAILGMVGGFLTPVLLSTGVDNPVGLFTYIALLDAGLIAVPPLVHPPPTPGQFPSAQKHEVKAEEHHHRRHQLLWSKKSSRPAQFHQHRAGGSEGDEVRPGSKQRHCGARMPDAHRCANLEFGIHRILQRNPPFSDTCSRPTVALNHMAASCHGERSD